MCSSSMTNRFDNDADVGMIVHDIASDHLLHVVSDGIQRRHRGGDDPLQLNVLRLVLSWISSY